VFTVFLVEDETLIRQNMRNAIEGGGDEFACAGEAADGELALTIIQDVKPDILVTDIKMPFMDGLTLARHAKAIIPWLRIIIVSGYDDFDLARQAIGIGVDHYILKPVSNRDLFSALRLSAQKITEYKRQSVSFLKNLSDEELVKNTLVTSFLERLCGGEVGSDEALRRSEELGVGLLARQYAVAVALCEDRDGIPHRQAVASKVKYLFSETEEVLCFMSGADRVVLIVKGATEMDAVGRAYHAAQTLKHELEDGLSASVTVGVSGVTGRISGLHEAWKEAAVLLKTFGGAQRGRIFGVGDLRGDVEGGASRLEELFNADLEGKLKFAGPADVPLLVEELMKNAAGEEVQGMLYRHYVLMDLTASAMRILKGLNPSLDRSELSGEFADRDRVVTSAVSARECTELATEICMKFIELRDRGGSCHHRKLVLRACEYIRENYNNPDISLNTVAAHVALSPAHFSTIFAQEMSETFIDHLTSVRIEKVKELLLSTDDKIVNIAFSVGYSEPNYLSYLFKKREGLSPKEYRQQKSLSPRRP